jgi:hypothetical protein
MPVLSKRVQGLALAAFLAIGLGARAVHAADISFEWWVNGQVAGSQMVTGTSIGNGVYNFAGTFQYFDPYNPFNVVELDYNLNGKPDSQAGLASNVFVNGNIAVENLFGTPIDVEVLVLLPVATPAPLGIDMGGSAALGLTTNADGGSVTSLPDTPVWQALVDESAVSALFHHPFELANSGLGSSSTGSHSFGIPDPIPGPPIADSIGIGISFTLTTLDQASITSLFNTMPIPAPGGLLVLAAGALAIRRRRRG